MSSIDDEANEYNQLTQQEKMRIRAPAPFGLDPQGSAIKTSETALTTEEFESKAKDSFLETKSLLQTSKFITCWSLDFKFGKQYQ